jgi:hypothetical protein
MVQEICKRRLWKQATLSTGTRFGNLEGGGGGVVYQELCYTVIFGPLFLDPKDARSLSLEAI